MGIGTYTANFFNETINYGYDIPLQYKIYGLVILIFILVELYLVFVKRIPVSSKYILWGFTFIILNIINMIVVSQVYLKKKGKFIGPAGEKGDLGEKGNEGENITCKLCDFNIYLQKTNRYDHKMNFSNNILKLIYNQDFNMLKIKQIFDNNKINYDNVVRDILNGEIPSATNSRSNLAGINKLINLQKYSLLDDLNNRLIKNYKDKNAMIKTPGRKRGYLPLGDIILTDNNESESYVLNGDIRYPTSFSRICSIYGVENDKKIKYDIMNLNGPDGYKGMSIAIFPSGFKTETNQYVCLNNNCIKPAKNQDLELVNIYPDSGNGFVSFWISAFNTLHINHATENNIKSGVRIIEILKDYNPDIYYNSGAVKKNIIKQVNNFLSKIKLNKLTIVAYIISSYMDIIKDDYKDFLEKYVKPLNIKLGIYANSDFKIEFNNVLLVLNKIETELNRIEEQYNLETAEKTDIPIENIIDDGSDIQTLIFNAKKLYTAMRKFIDFIPAHIDNCETLLDLVEYIFKKGIDTRLKKITKTQKSLIYLLKCSLPPINDTVFIPQNKCLVYENIDEDRIELIDNCDKIIDKYNEIINKVNMANSNLTDNERIAINKEIELIKYRFDTDFSNILDYDEKMKNGNFREFADSQLESIIANYSGIINLIQKFNQS